MRNESYTSYIKSEKWKIKRLQAFAYYGKKCMACGSLKNIKVHHKTYDRLGRELMSDLAVCCNSCHINIHKLARKLGGKLDVATDKYIYLKRMEKFKASDKRNTKKRNRLY